MMEFAKDCSSEVHSEHVLNTYKINSKESDEEAKNLLLMDLFPNSSSITMDNSLSINSSNPVSNNMYLPTTVEE